MLNKKLHTCTVRNVLVFCAVLLVMLLIGQPAPGSSEPAVPAGKEEKQVVILYSQPRGFPATEMVEKGLHDVLAEQTQFSIQLFPEYLDLSRFRDTAQRQALADLLHQRYHAKKIDLIICVDVPAAHFLMDYGEYIFPLIPIVVCSVPEALGDQLLASPLKNRVNGILEPAAMAQQLVDSALRLKPGTKNAVLIAGAFEK